LAHQTHLTILEHDLITPRLRFVEGAIDVPTGPGIGVVPLPKRLDACTIRRATISPVS